MASRNPLTFIVLLSCVAIQVFACQMAFSADQSDLSAVVRKYSKPASMDYVAPAQHQDLIGILRQSDSNSDSSPRARIQCVFHNAIAFSGGCVTEQAKLLALPRPTYSSPIWLVHRSLLI